jgi:hypothetical protein
MTGKREQNGDVILQMTPEELSTLARCVNFADEDSDEVEAIKKEISDIQDDIF